MKTKQPGFTIVEILIVLAVAGVVMLVVFLAVPTLQRNTRNTQRRQDITALLSAVKEYSLNHGGAVPASTGPFDTKFGAYAPSLGYFEYSTIQWIYSSTPRTNQYYYGVYDSATNQGVVDGAYIENYLKCGPDTLGRQAGVVTNATVKDVVALYRLEDPQNSAVKLVQCSEM